MSENKKTSAKRLGVKTILASEKRGLGIAAFGQGAQGLLVHRDGEAAPRDLGPFSLKTTEPSVDVWRGANEARLPNPVLELANEDRADFVQDYLLLKDEFEKEVFGRAFPNDNVRIQLAHNVFDMLKIFGVYVADVVYALDNLALSEEEKAKTVELGTSLNEEKADQFLDRLRPYFEFFGGAFKTPPKSKFNGRPSSKAPSRSPQTSPEDQRNKKVLRILGQTRQIAAHFQNASLLFAGNEKLAAAYKSKKDDLWSVVASDYAERIERIDGKFLERSTTNLNLLFEIYDARTFEERRALVEDYYDFAIVKSGKNFGVNMKKVREFALEAFYPQIQESRYDSYRSKLYVVADYILYRWASDSLLMEKAIPSLRSIFADPNPEKREQRFLTYREKNATAPQTRAVFDAIAAASPEEREILFDRYKRSRVSEAIADLRQSADEEEKDALYQELAQDAWEATRETLEPFFARFADSYAVFSTEKLDASLFERVRSKAKTSGSVAEGGPASIVALLSFLSNFWEGKEINEILTAFIRKFENIQAFIDLLTELGDKPNFSERYALLNELKGKMAGKIARQLRFLASVGKMKPDMERAKRVLYKTAIQTLGVSDDSAFVSDEWLDQNVFLTDAPTDQKRGTQPPKTFRNFIARNVISSNRFAYLVRYATPRITRATMNNAKIVRYVLSRLPETQIDRYYERVDEPQPNASRSVKIDALTQKLVGFSFERVENAQTQIVESAQDAKRSRDASPQTVREIAKRRVAVERLKALTSLYLTVAYVALKNVVKTNARYFIAYAIFERDLEMLKRLRGEEALKPFYLTFKYVDQKGATRTDANKLFAPLRWYLRREDDQDFKPTEEHLRDPELFRAACKAHLKKIRRHFAKRQREIFALNYKETLEISPTGYIATQARNDAAHFNVLKHWTRYVADFRRGSSGEAKSYFEMYHYVQQRLALEVPELNLDRYRALILKTGVPCSDLMKLAYLPLGYCLPRYKNLTIDALFDKDGADGQARERRQAEARAKKRRGDAGAGDRRD